MPCVAGKAVFRAARPQLQARQAAPKTANRCNRRNPGIRIAAKRHKKRKKTTNKNFTPRQNRDQISSQQGHECHKDRISKQKASTLFLWDLLWDWSCIFFELFVPLGGYSLFLLSAKGPLFCQSPNSDRSVVYVALRTEAESSRCILCIYIEEKVSPTYAICSRCSGIIVVRALGRIVNS
jgi:hypothetical protein